MNFQKRGKVLQSDFEAGGGAAIYVTSQDKYAKYASYDSLGSYDTLPTTAPQDSQTTVDRDSTKVGTQDKKSYSNK